MANSEKYIVLIGDIISSREIIDRDDFQTLFQNVIQNTYSVSNDSIHPRNHTNQPRLVSPFTLTLGDEFQAVYRFADNIFKDAFWILTSIFPVKVRFSFGIGQISTAINTESALGMDGEAFYNAREGIDILKSNKDDDTLFIIKGLRDEKSQKMYNDTLALVSKQAIDWRANRMKIFSQSLEGIQIKNIKDNVDLTSQAVYKNISQAYLDIIKNIFGDISILLNINLEAINE